MLFVNKPPIVMNLTPAERWLIVERAAEVEVVGRTDGKEDSKCPATIVIARPERR